MGEIERDLYKRIGKLEDSMSDIKVDLAQTYKDLINHHQMDEVNSKIYKEKLAAIEEATKDKDAGKSKFAKWVGQVLTPQTVAIIVTIIATV
jgi:hypothetical protein